MLRIARRDCVTQVRGMRFHGCIRVIRLSQSAADRARRCASGDPQRQAALWLAALWLAALWLAALWLAALWLAALWLAQPAWRTS